MRQVSSAPALDRRGCLVILLCFERLPGPGGLDVSLYASGLICADLLGRRRVVMDVGGRRIGFERMPQAADNDAAQTPRP